MELHTITKHLEWRNYPSIPQLITIEKLESIGGCKINISLSGCRHRNKAKVNKRSRCRTRPSRPKIAIAPHPECYPPPAQETWVCAVGAAAQQGCRTWFSFCNRITAKQNHNVASCGPKPGRTKVGTAVAPRLACDDCWSTGSLRLLGGPPPRVGPSWARRAASKAPPLTSFVPLQGFFPKCKFS